MRLLVSLCAATEQAPESLLIVDPDSGSIEPVAIDLTESGVMGLSASRSQVLAVVDLGRPVGDEPERSALIALQPTDLHVRWHHSFDVGRDVHSIAFDGPSVYATSTGTDELLRLALDNSGVVSEDVVWSTDPENAPRDRHHLNGVALLEGDVLVSGFGPRPSVDAWREARDGYVRSIKTERELLRPIYHPHSICRISLEEVAVCESPLRRIVTTAGRFSDRLPGYARGLCLAEGRLFAGTSRDRRPAEPRSILPYDPVPSDAGVAAVCELDVDDLTVRNVIELEPYGREVFDIVGLPEP